MTEYGELLKRRLDGVFSVLDGLPKEIEQLKKDNSFTVKLNVLAASIAVMEAVVQYKNKFPEVVFNLIQNEEKSDCDISVTTAEGIVGTTSADNRSVLEENIYMAVPKNSRFAEKESLTFEELSEEKFIYIAGSRPFRTICDKICQRAGFKPNIGFESDSPIAVKNIIGAEAGVGFWPEYSWGKIKSKEIVLKPIAGVECKREIIIEKHQNQSGSKYAQDFYNYLIKYLSRKN